MVGDGWEAEVEPQVSEHPDIVILDSPIKAAEPRRLAETGFVDMVSTESA